MIIHITGCAGSGKTTLGKRLAKNKKIVVIESDEIEDKNAIKIINNKKYDNLFTMKNIGKFFELLKEKNESTLDDMINKIKKKYPDKIIIVVGLTIDVKNANKKQKIFYKNRFRYFI